MTAIDRTAYPRLGARLTREELAVRYHLTETDRAFIDARARGDTGRLMLATLLKTRRDLGRFPASDEVHAGTVAYLAAQLGVAAPQAWSNERAQDQDAVSLPGRGASPPFPHAI